MLMYINQKTEGYYYVMCSTVQLTATNIEVCRTIYAPNLPVVSRFLAEMVSRHKASSIVSMVKTVSR